MNVQFSGNPKPFGVIGLIIAIFSLIFSLIPCIGFYAFIPALLGVIFCAVNYMYRKQQKDGIGVPVAGIIVGGVAILIAISQFLIFRGVFEAKAALDDAEQEMVRRVGEKILENAKEKLENDIAQDSVQYEPKDSLEQK